MTNKIFANNYSDYGIVINPTDRPNGDGEIYTICPECDKYRKPEHKGQKKLGVKILEGYWGCSHCGWSGHLLTEDYLKSAKIKPTTEKASGMISDKIVRWFWEKRKISLETLKKCKVGVTEHVIMQSKNPDSSLIGKFAKKKCIAFNYYYNNLLINIKYRDEHKNFGLVKGADMIFYGLDNIKDCKEAIIVEGEIDVLSFIEAGITNVVSVPNGASISEKEKEHFEKTGQLITEKQQNLEYLDKCWNSFENKEMIYIGTDNDAAGIKLRDELSRRLGKERCRILDYEDCNDANDILFKYGKEKLASLVEQSGYYPIEDIITAEDVWKELEYEFDNKKEKGKSTGFLSLDPHFRWRLGDLVLLNGYPSEGKTSILFNLLITTSILYKWKWGMWCPENYPEKRIYDTLAEILVGNSSDIDRDGRMTKEEYRNAVKGYLHKYIYLVSAKKRYTPAEMRLKSKEMIQRLGIVGFVKDPWSALKHDFKGKTVDNYLSDVLADETNFAIQNNIINVIVHHPPTPIRDKDKNYPAPSQFELIGGQVWFQKAYVQLCIHRENKNDKHNTNTQFHVQKSKEHKLIGIPTMRNNPPILTFDRRSGRFKEMIKGNLISPLDGAYKELFDSQKEFEGF